MGEIRKGELNLMFDGYFIPVGEAEILITEDNRIEKIVSFTPREFPVPEGDALKVPSVRVDPKDVPRFDEQL